MSDEITATLGEVIPASIDAPIGINQVARITDGDGKLAYLVGYVAPQMQPSIQSAKTGNVFALSWADIVKLGVEKGVDEYIAPVPIMPEEKKIILLGD